MGRKHTALRILIWMWALALALAFPATAFATDISVTADSTSVKAGDTVTVTVTVSGEHIAVADGVFTYDPSLLSYIGSTGGASDGHINMVSAQQGGASSLTAVIRFAATGAGDAEIRVSLESVLGYDGQDLGSAEAGVSIAVAPTETAPTATGAAESAPPIDISLTGVAAENVMGAAAPMYIWRSLDSLTLPSGFADRQVNYRGEYVGGAAIPDSEDMILLYLSEKAGENAGYYIYDAQKDTLFPYLTVQSVSRYFTLIWPDESVAVPEGYGQTTFIWKEKEVPAWIAEGGDGSVYLVYARNSAGEKGLYLYNVEDESVQRYIAPPAAEPEPTAAPTAEPTTKPASAQAGAEWTADPVVFFALCGVCAVLVVSTVVFAQLYVKASRGQRKAASIEKKYEEASEDKKADV